MDWLVVVVVAAVVIVVVVAVVAVISVVTVEGVKGHIRLDDGEVMKANINEDGTTVTSLRRK